MKLLDNKCYEEMNKVRNEVYNVINSVSDGKIKPVDSETKAREISDKLTALGYTCKVVLSNRSYNHGIEVKSSIGDFKITYYRSIKNFKVGSTINYRFIVTEEDTPVAFASTKNPNQNYRFKKIGINKYEVPGFGWSRLFALLDNEDKL